MTSSISRRGSRAPSTLSGPLSTVRYTVNGVSFDMVRVPPGRFIDGEGPNRRELLVSRPFELGVTLVTQALWQAVMTQDYSDFHGEDRPVDRVSWEDARELVNNLAWRGLPGFRLPTEAEWVWAARCGAPTQWAGADRAETSAVINSKKTDSVAGLSCSAAGFFDLSGNVAEWTGDTKHYRSGIDIDNQDSVFGLFRILRGGNWLFGPHLARVTHRNISGPSLRYHTNGFRLARTSQYQERFMQ